ncbi:UDP-N-acetylmuramoylalanine--D-glutamate ligase [Desulfurobacterium thermolithotrophum DSM 11699]|uniref:UDP-N-acetylmuramoylalanine--D-glutamate ligase n=1 Tax=Desulfurobacterium thermolithotrophum (strain DSM 11699 / BSA) TaxID=868864 RepID=F0S2Q6_DESTD|nr:UDP-N-acetylmuramoyl-L-alanine--D-glutamate ligase [Desulfurobacterium thermolithotrophum]ADY73128.1 UDP-N-acetylmuramoylalanine--D-glutamate ligase [Desulfurobacterium thermolithotrophum DSM 11699]
MKAVVLGKGKSGKAAAELLEKKGYKVILYDDKEPTKLPDFPDLVVKSPGIPSYHSVVVSYKKKGIEVIGEIELAYRYFKGKIISITGTNGKSTTTALIYQVLKEAGYKTFIGGNFGIPFSSFAEETTDDSITVLELSSFQIEDLKDFRSSISIILNITPDHMNRYKSFEEYVKAKLKLLGHSEFCILNQDDPVLRNLNRENFFFFSRKRKADAFFEKGKIFCKDFKIEVELLPLKGIHNVENYMGALLALKKLKLSNEKILNGFKTFYGLPHRTELVAEINGIKFINDSKSTNVDSLKKALESYEDIILIAGGSDKGLDFSSLRKLVRERVKGIVAIGETAEQFKKTFSDIVDVRISDNIFQAVKTAYKLASSGDVVLLSPGCASFDMFKNFEDRGEKFREAVKLLEEKIAG